MIQTINSPVTARFPDSVNRETSGVTGLFQQQLDEAPPIDRAQSMQARAAAFLLDMRQRLDAARQQIAARSQYQLAASLRPVAPPAAAPLSPSSANISGRVSSGSGAALPGANITNGSGSAGSGTPPVSAAPASGPAPAASAPAGPPMTSADKYWAKQPKEVQALRYMEDPAARRAKALDLAHQGFTIDVPIMVWDWDPEYTMNLRQMYGYTWVPSALQSPVQIAPGLNMPGMNPYDPNHAPQGSILVSTDFAA